MSKVDIIIVNWNAGQQLRDCVDSIIEYGGSNLGRVIVVDNNSSDQSLHNLEPLGSQVEIIRESKNIGFGRACNLGAQKSDSPYLLFLNPDARLLPNCLNKTLNFMESRAAEGFGICGVRLLDEQGNTQRHCARFPNALTYFGYSTGLGTLIPKWLPSLQMSDFDHQSSREVDHVIGAYFFVRHALFKELSGFDERFFVYLEDLDFSLRAHGLGQHSYYLAETCAFHRGGGTSEQIKAQRLFYSLSSRLLFCFIHLRPWEAWVVTILTLTIEPLSRSLRAVLRGSIHEFRDTIRAYRLLTPLVPSLVRTGRTRV